MAIRISFYGRVFAPSLWMTLITLVLAMAFVSLGRWQWHRGLHKEALWSSFESAAPADSKQRVDLDTVPRYFKVALDGRYEPDRQFLLDNRVVNGRPGYEVLTPFVLNDGRRILVNRGWVPFAGRRDELPDTRMTHDAARVTGRLDELPSAGLQSGRAPPSLDGAWPKVTSYPTHAELEAALGTRISRRMLLLDPEAPEGLLRQWSPPGMTPDRHFSYAMQWWGFAVVLVVLYFALNFRKVS